MDSSMTATEDEQETVVDHFEMQKAGPDELIFAQNEVGDCAMLSFRNAMMPWQDTSNGKEVVIFLQLHYEAIWLNQIWLLFQDLL